MISNGTLQNGCDERHDVRFRKRWRCLLRVQAVWVKRRNTRSEHISSALPLKADSRTQVGHRWRSRGSPDVAGCSAYPSIAVISISLPDRREGPMHKTRHCVAFRVYASPRSRSITVSGIPGAHCLRLWRALAESNDRNLSRLLSCEARARTVSG